MPKKITTIPWPTQHTQQIQNLRKIILIMYKRTVTKFSGKFFSTETITINFEIYFVLIVHY